MKICILHLNQIGDLIFALPLIENLRANYEQAEIHSVIKPYLSGLLEGAPDEIIARPDGVKPKLQLIKRLRQERYDLIISLARSEECMLITALSGARLKAGFKRAPLDVVLDKKIKIEGHNSWFNTRRLLEELGLKITKNDYCGLLKAEGDISHLELPERFAVISPGASSRRMAKCWDNQKFAELLARLHNETDLSFVLVGSQENAPINELIADQARQLAPEIEIMDLAGKLGLKPLCSLLRKASLFVGIDSGVMHMASSLEVPTVGLFGPTDPFYVGPQNEKSIVVRSQMDCLPCYLKPCDHLDCMQGLSVDSVLNACKKIL